MRQKRKSKVPVLDLHGQTQNQVFGQIEDFLRKYGHRPKIKIMTGKGTGAIQKKTKEYLEIGSYPWTYERLPNGDLNRGVLLVFLD